MLLTTTPSLIIALVVFAVVGVNGASASLADSHAIAQSIEQTFNISPYLLVVPLITGMLIAKKLPAIVTLFASAFMAAVAMVVAQPEITMQIAQTDTFSALNAFKAVVTAVTTSTSIQTDNELLTSLIATRGMGGMMDTIWLITCAMCFGGVMYGSGMLSALSQIFLRMARRTVGVVGSTVGSGIFFNLATGDQYISIILTGNLFRQLYHQRNLENRLLSRSVEDSATVTSVLIPWNSCGMTQSTVLGVATLTYMPYCIFNIVSPLISILVAALGWKIYKHSDTDE
jgi:NhaC family Na+:H+ antiporter